MKKQDKIKEEEIKLKTIIGSRIKRARQKLNKSAAWVADRVNLTRSGLSQVENGKSNVNAVTLWEIACALRVDMNDFFPVVPESSSVDKQDLEKIRKEDETAAKLMKDAFLNK